MPDQSTGIEIAGIPVVAFDPLKYPLAQNLANGFRCPVGFDHGEGHVLLFRSDLESLGAGPFELRLAADEPVVIKKVWIHSAHRVNYGGSPDDPSAVYLARLVDRRFFLRWSSCSRLWNVRNLSGGDPNRKYYRETVPALETPWKWSQILSQLWSDCGLGAFPGVQGDNGNGDDDLIVQGRNAWQFFNQCLSRLGRVVAYDPIADLFTLPRLVRDASPLDKDVERLLFDARPYSSAACSAPEYIRVSFSKKWEDYGSENDSDAESNWIAAATHSIDIPTGVPGAIAGTVLTLWASAPAMIKHKTKNAISNGGELSAIANRMAAAWLFENAGDRLSRANLIVNGARAKWLPGESIREVVWRNYGDGLVTEILKYPGLPTDAAAAGGVSGFDTFSENDLGRKTTPNYPRVPNIVQIDDPQSADGASRKATENGLHPGYVWRFVEGRAQKQEKCWIQFVDGWDSKKGDVDAINKEFYSGRLEGREEYAGERLPLYVAKRGSDSEGIVRFRLKEDLATGKDARAVRLVRIAGGYAEREAIRVFDWYTTPRGMWQAKSEPGYQLVTEGFAMRRESQPGANELPEFDIVWMETFAWTVEFELRQKLAGANGVNGNVAKALVLKAYEQGKDPSNDDGDVLVFDDSLLFPYGMAGCRGIATRSEHEPLQPYYKIVQCQQMGFLATAELYEDMCTTMPTVKIKKNTFLITTFSPFNAYPDPIPEEVLNTFAHAAPQNYLVSLRYDHNQRRWIVDDVLHRYTRQVMTNFVAGMCFKDTAIGVAAESCEIAGGQTWHCGTDCAGVAMGGDDIIEGGGGSGG